MHGHEVIEEVVLVELASPAGWNRADGGGGLGPVLDVALEMRFEYIIIVKP